MQAGSIRPLHLLGAGLLLVGGAIHVALAFDGYGTSELEQLFFLNGAVSAIVAAAVVLVRNPVPTLAGVGVATVSLLAFALSSVGGGVVGFRGTGLDPVPEVPATLVVELAAVVVLGTVAYRDRRRVIETVSVRR